MKKLVISVLGTDRPGIVAAVSRVLFEHGCNIEDVNQTILQTEFAGVFVASVPADLDAETLQGHLQKSVQHMGVKVLVKDLEAHSHLATPPSEPFVVTTVGPETGARRGYYGSDGSIRCQYYPPQSRFPWRRSPPS